MTTTSWDLPPDALTADEDSFLDACRQAPDHLIYFVLNVGDGDTQLLLLPARPERSAGGPPAGAGRTHGRRAIVVDVATTDKLPALLDALADAGVLDPAEEELLPLVVGTHPHRDHLGGMPQLLRRYGPQIGQYWEPGYFHPSDVYVETMVALEDHPRIRHLQPTSGTSCFIDAARVTALTPGIGLRGRFDTYGIGINDASVSLRVEFPTTRIAREPADDGVSADRTYLRLDAPWALLLGSDSQTTSWAQALVDFPQLHRDHDPGLVGSLRAAMGADPLGAHILKVPHHASKRGINLELVERIQPRLTVISSVAGGGRYNFPHPLTVELLREALEPIGTKPGAARTPDHELGIHCTGASTDVDGEARPAGSVAVLVPPRRGSRLRVWRLGDGPRDAIDLRAARRLRSLR